MKLINLYPNNKSLIKLQNLFFRNKDNYFIDKKYLPRMINSFHDDISFEDEYQNEVYQLTKDFCLSNNYSKILDIGVGSAYKLIKYFNEFETLGIDLPRTVKWLRSKYPNKKWSDKLIPLPGYDLIIAADVIEHMRFPNKLISLIKKSSPKVVVFSTPDRSLLKSSIYGPPKNIAHVREWTFNEFASYISFHFDITFHEIVNKNQATQMIIAKIKKTEL